MIRIEHRVYELWNHYERIQMKPMDAIIQVSCILLIRRLPKYDPNIFIHKKEEEILDLFNELFSSILYDSTFNTLNKSDIYNNILDSTKINDYFLRDIIAIIESIYNNDSTNYNFETDSIIFESLITTSHLMVQGEYFAIPHHIIKLMTKLVNPQQKDRILDPACGTGGFLLAAYENVLKDLVQTKIPNSIELDIDGFPTVNLSNEIRKNYKKELLPELVGIEENKELCQLAALNLLLKGINAQLHNLNYFSFSKYQDEALSNKFNVILANPPFKGEIIDEHNNFRITSQKVEIQFIDKISRSLSINGKAAIIVPENFLTNKNKYYMQCRQLLLEENQLEAVISLPAGTFSPQTNGKASILILTKSENRLSEPVTQKVWFYELESVGYSLDRNKKRMKENPLADLITIYENRFHIENTERFKTGFFVTIKEIEDNNWFLNCSRYKRFDYKRQEYKACGVLLKNILQKEKEIMEDLNEIESIIPWEK